MIVPTGRIFRVALLGASATAVLLQALASEAQPQPATTAEMGTSWTRSTVTDPKSGIAGARLSPTTGNFPARHLPLNEPQWRGSAEADHMQANDAVAGISLHGKSWALPLWFLTGPHVANLNLEGQPLLISYCERCRSAIARDPVVGNRRLTFHLAGVYNGSILLADYETGSYWTPFTGEALEGPLKGTKLKQVPIIQSRWQRWLELHPDTLVAYAPRALGARYADLQRRGSANVASGLLQFLLQPRDDRLPFDELVLGITLRNNARAYPLSTIETGKSSDKESIALNDTLGDEPIVILHERGGTLTTVFSRRLRGKTLHFATDKTNQFVDSTYHSHWNYDGEAVDGLAVGQKLSDVPSQVEDWYIWTAFHPVTSIYGLQGARAAVGQGGSGAAH